VKDAIFKIDKKYGRNENDHQWPNFTTIHKYEEYYKTNKFGWYKLKWNEPAPSFGNVMKTYTLHPDGERVVSVREVMSIMGFPETFKFPKEMGHTNKYQMVADVVSPIFSEICADIIKEII
jgi:DNA (cytosine-5)-methyltransferase 1